MGNFFYGVDLTSIPNSLTLTNMTTAGNFYEKRWHINNLAAGYQ